MYQRTKLAVLIAQQEGFGKPGTIPTLRHNPGDLRHSPHSSHQGIGPNDVGQIDNDVDGWEDLERQLRMMANRGLTLRQCIEAWAPPSDGNNTAVYLQNICDGLHLPAGTPLHVALTLKA